MITWEIKNVHKYEVKNEILIKLFTAVIYLFMGYAAVLQNSCVVLKVSSTQDYDVNEIQCSFASQSNTIDSITAKLKKPVNFKGSPLFADDRLVNPEEDPICSIKPDLSDSTELNYDLKISDFSHCGVLKRNGFVHVRIWFPQFTGVVMQSDQELIIMCKPPEPTIIQNKAAGFAGSFPHGARVTGVVEETPGRLEYEVALYKEAPPAGRIHGHNIPKNQSSIASIIKQNELPVDQAVQIGTKLQLRARINPQSVWKYVKLMEVSVSPDPDNPYSPGSVALVKDGCRNRDFTTIIPHQPARYRDRPNEVFLDFEAFLLSSMKERSTLWIHSQIKACVDLNDCHADFCSDLFEQSGHGKRKRSIKDNTRMNEFANFNENIEYAVILPGDYENQPLNDLNSCKNFVYTSVVLSILLTLSTFMTCLLLSKFQYNNKKLTNASNREFNTARIQHIEHTTLE